MTELVIRLAVSLTVVLTLFLVLAKFGARRIRGGSGAAIQVLHRQALSRSSSVAVIAVGSRLLVVGTTEQHVELLTELDPEDLDVAESPVPVEMQPHVRAARAADGALAGSVLSAQTWKDAFAAATHRDREAS